MKNLGPNLLPADGEVYYVPGMLSPQQADAYFNELLAGVKWKQEPIKIFGREIMQPRLTAWYGDKVYSYSGLTMQPSSWIKPLSEIKSIADSYAHFTSSSALLNLYRDEKDSMGWHRDNEKALGPAPVIASVSLGAARKFELRRYDAKKPFIALVLEAGSLLIMKGESQKYWEHRLPKLTSPAGARINITFRRILS
jgi:alkylated DNA repair dioxygenase AlkB